ncbi:unnamed protein product [Citrullus colocynthis]|uniref:Uncharacterized protein n=1 Tax=Citrullus colocynthis TaxID=252529 RepID=A0ABP0XZ51_9ROSI
MPGVGASLIATTGVGSWEFMFMPHGILYRDIDVGNVLNFDVYFSFDQFGLVLLWGIRQYSRLAPSSLVYEDQTMKIENYQQKHQRVIYNSKESRVSFEVELCGFLEEFSRNNG